MKILMTLMGLEIGGAETHVVELSKELAKQGHTIIVASNGGVYEQALGEANIRHEKIPMHQRSFSKMALSLTLLEKLIRREKPDLVHAHARIPGFLCGILHRRMGFPFITSAHWVFQVTPLLRLITDWGQRTVAVSEDIKDYLMDNYQIPADQIHVTINGIDTVQFAPNTANDALWQSLGLGSGPVIGTVSRLDRSRELAAKELIGLMPRLLRQIPNAQLLIVGGGNEEENLRRQAQEVNLSAGRNAIIMTGPSTDIANLVALCDIFVGVSRAALEAMSAEKPTILAGNEGYIGVFQPEVLSLAQQTNFCCRGCDPIDSETMLGDLIRLLKTDAAGLRQMGSFGRRVVLEQYSVAKMTQDYLQAYHKLLHPENPIRATISGYYGYGNLGDDAILLAISRQLEKCQAPVQLTALSRHPEETVRQYGIRAVHRFSPWKVARTIRQSDVLISGGGSLLQDKTSTRSLLYYLAVIRLAKLMKKPVFVYANGIGPVIKQTNRRKVRDIMDRCDVVTLRDHNSLSELRSLGVSREDLFVTADPAFTLVPDPEKESIRQRYEIPASGNLIGISVRNVAGSEHFAMEFARLCDRLTREQGKHIVFLIMQESEDEAISRQIQTLMQERSYCVKTPGDPGSMLALIEQMDLVVSMRLHTIIFAADVNVPVVGCVYDPKVAAFLDILNMPSCGTPATIDADETYLLTTRMLSQLPRYREQLAQCVKTLAHSADKTIEIFENLIQNL